MPKPVEVEVKGLKATTAFLIGKSMELKRKEEQGVKDATIFVQGEIKKSIARGTNAPVAVDTGNFLRSVDFQVKDLDGKVFSDISYAKYIEYGTSKMKARPHFRNTKAKKQNEVIKIIQDKIKGI